MNILSTRAVRVVSFVFRAYNYSGNLLFVRQRSISHSEYECFIEKKGRLDKRNQLVISPLIIVIFKTCINFSNGGSQSNIIHRKCYRARVIQ